MTRGYSLEQDLRLLINNPKYSDLEIVCEDEKKLYGCRAILAARSEVFDRLLYNGMKESYEKQISFPKINSAGMEIILEYTYTGSIKEESLTIDNTIEAFYAADYFQLPDLQDFIMKTLKNTNFAKNYSPELLSKVSGKIPLTEDNILLNLLVETVANISLNNIEFGRLSITGLQCLLSCTYEKEKPFATPEYEVFRYSAILVAKQVSNDAHKILMRQLPTLEQLENTNSINVYRRKALSNDSDSNGIRGKPQKPIDFAESNYVWDESARGSKLIIEDNGKVVRATNDLRVRQNIRAKMILENEGIFEWDVIIEKDCSASWVGVCASENFNYETWAGDQPTGWVLGSNGRCYSGNRVYNNYCQSFGDGAKITVHIDMNKRTCSFTVKGTKYPEISAWNNLPSKLYPVASLCYPGRIRIQPR
ncbi:17550_t:CDS:2 [Rhizophagus irregularis]|nr:17550_t:CDS:2 [Rhizophagus irregularis]